MAGNIRLYNTSGYVELQAPSSASAQVLELPTDSIQPGLVHLHTETFSAQSTVSIDDVFSSEYDNYQLIAQGTGSANVAWNLRYRVSGSDNSTSNYYMQQAAANSTTLSAARDSGQSSTRIGFGDYCSFTATIFDPQNATNTRFVSQVIRGATTTLWQTNASWFDAVTQFDGFTLFPASGTITGTLRVYGYRNS